MKHRFYRSGPAILLLILFLRIHAQDLPEPISARIEHIVNDEERSAADVVYVQEELAYLAENPLDINRDKLDVLLETGLLSESLLVALRDHMDRFGPLLSMAELQTIRGWDPGLIRTIEPFVVLSGALDDLHRPNTAMRKAGKNEITTYIRKPLERARGFRAEQSTGLRPYGGLNLRSYLRYRYRYHQKVSYGLILEHDPGEDLFGGTNTTTDFVTFHVYLRNLSSRVRSVAIGDYRISFGQGLIAHSGFGGGKSPHATGIRKGGRTFRPHTSPAENGFFRGAAIEYALLPKWTAALCVSSRKLDGNLVQGNGDTTSTDQADRISSLQTSGLHRTGSEKEDEKAVRMKNIGARIRYRNRWLSLGINMLQTSLDKYLEPGRAPYQLFRFRGSTLGNASFDFTARHRNLEGFGEFARSHNGGTALLAGLQFGIGRNVDLSLSFRHYGRRYQTLFANAFGDASRPENETGWYAGLRIRPLSGWTFSCYADMWRHPWLQYRAPFPTHGRDFACRLGYEIRRRVEVYAQWRSSEEEISVHSSENNYDRQQPVERTRIRLHLNYHVTRALEWRCRVEFTSVREPGRTASGGYLLFQDLLYKPVGSPLSFTCRYSIFDTEDRSVKIYSYENNLLYNFGIPAYSEKGRRFYINLRLRPSAAVTMEARYAHTLYAGKEVVGNGKDEIVADHRSEIALQFRYSW